MRIVLDEDQDEEQSEEFFAAQYRFGEPPGEVQEVARRYEATASITEVPEWRLLLVRVTLGSGEYHYYVVVDGGWFVFSPQSNVIFMLTDADMRESFGEGLADHA